MTEPRYLWMDCETFSAGREFELPPKDFVRLTQYAVNDGPVVLTEDLDEIKREIEKADYIVGHNLQNSDLPWIFGVDSDVPMELALAGKVIDTFVLASIVNPAPYSYTDSKGHTYYNAAAPERAMEWLSLENQAYQLGAPGKLGDLSEIAKRYNPEGTKKADLEYGLIDLNDPEFREYAEGDVHAVRGIARSLIQKLHAEGHSGEYVWREMIVAACTARISNNGISVDKELAQNRIDELAEERDKVMSWLVKAYSFPEAGKSPWATKKGKEVIMAALADYGITPESRPDWERTATGNISLGGAELIRLTEGSEAERLGRALATLKGQRSLAQLALDSTKADGKVHPSIIPLQRSSRWSVLRPGLTTWTARGDNAVEKAYFTATPGRKIVSFDFSNADARVVAAYSGDPQYAKRFFPDENGNLPDGHELNGRAAFGDEAYDSDPAHYRYLSKALGHGWSYGGRAKTLSKQAGIDLEIAEQFVDNMDKKYAWLVAWQMDIRKEGDSGWITTEWGRKHMIDPDRSWTQSPAIAGQGGTREILADGLVRMAKRDKRLLHWVVAIIHDEILADIPEEELDWAVPTMVECLETTFHPKKHPYSQPIPMTVGHGEPADNWFSASH